MKALLTFILLLVETGIFFAQTSYSDILIANSVYSEAPIEIQQTKPFIRQRWFFEQRAYPNNFIPQDAYANAMIQRDELRQQNADRMPSINWVSLGPTPGYYFNYGNISSRVVTGTFDPTNPGTIYIGPANGGVWKSTDSGVNWTPLTDNEASMSMGAIAVDPANSDNIYAGTGEATYSGASYYGRGLLKSTDAGITWEHITNGLPSASYFSRIKIRPNHSNELLAALGNAGLVRSTNYGQSWNTVFTAKCDDIVFTFTGDTVYTAGSASGFRRSVDGGQSFTIYGTGLSFGQRIHFDICLASSNVMYASVYGSSNVLLYKTTDYGLNWSQLATTSAFQNQGGQAWYDLYCRVNQSNPDIAYVGTIDVWRTTDGTNFINITNGYSGGYVHVDQHYLFFHPTDPNNLIVCNDGGIWRSTNGGTSFINLNQNLTLTQFYRIAASPFTPSRILGGTQDNGTQQTYSALNWAAAYGGDGGEVCFNPFDSNFILGETQNGGIFRTTNGGSSWNSSTGGISSGENVTWVAPIIADPVTNGTFYTARQRVYKSTNNGGVWTAISGNVNSNSAVREMGISKSNPLIIYATSGSNVFLSTDGGVTFTNKTSGIPSRTITSVNVHPVDENIAILTFSGFGAGKIYKTTNMGNTWFSISGNLPDSPVNDGLIYTYDALNPNTYFVATDIGVFLTQDNGSSWVELQNNLPNTVIMHLDYTHSNQMLRAGTHGRGVYEAFIDFTVPVELSSFTAEIFKNSLLLNWSTATETNNLGFEIERKLKNQDWITIAFVNGKGTTTEIQYYNYSDDYSELPYEGTVLYRLKQIDYNGDFEYSVQVAVNLTFVPSEYYVSQNYPNPFNPSTTIKYSLPVESNVRINIYNSIGEMIDELVSETQSSGNYEVTWNAQNYSSGIYYYSFEVSSTDGSNSHREMKKIVFLK